MYAVAGDFGAGIAALAPFVDINRPRLLKAALAHRLHCVRSSPTGNQSRSIGSSVAPLVAAVTCHRIEAALALLAIPGIEPNARMTDGRPLLFEAIMDGRLMRALFEHPAIDINAMDWAGNTILHTICAMISTQRDDSSWNDINNIGPVQLRLALGRGADRTLLNAEGKTAWEVAIGKCDSLNHRGEPADHSEWIHAVIGQVLRPILLWPVRARNGSSWFCSADPGGRVDQDEQNGENVETQ
jgi:hypothetical protein